MTILEAGIIAGAPVGAAIGGMLGRSNGTLATVGFATGGLMAGAAAGWLFAALVIVLLSVINVFWRAVRKRPPDPPSESDMEIMTRVAVRATFVSAVASAVVFTESGWLPALVTLTMSAFITAFLSVARCELRQAE
jgi:hypothetical protein